MTESLHYFNLTLGVLAIALQIVCILLLILLFLLPKSFNFKDKFFSFISEHFLIIGFIISFLATILSLFYSQVIGYAPCFLCWLQRIFFFPQVILFGVALYKKDRGVAVYAFPLILLGTLISIYHNFIYYFGESLAPCDASGVSCVQRLVNEIGGYASIPMFSFTMFLSFCTLFLIFYFYKKETI